MYVTTSFGPSPEPFSDEKNFFKCPVSDSLTACRPIPVCAAPADAHCPTIVVRSTLTQPAAVAHNPPLDALVVTGAGSDFSIAGWFDHRVAVLVNGDWNTVHEFAHAPDQKFHNCNDADDTRAPLIGAVFHVRYDRFARV